MQPTNPAGTSRDNPLYFKFLRDGEDNLQLGKIVVALALSVLSAYLATQAQRAGSGPDQMKAAKMRFHRTTGLLAARQAQFWLKIADNARDRYEIAKL